MARIELFSLRVMDWMSVDMAAPISPVDLFVRMLLATVFGGLIGWDREANQKAAGLRTHMLVSLGSAVFTLTAFEVFDLSTNKNESGDPSRVIQGIAGGIGFLGAGQIIQSRGAVAGVTTAAGIWVVGALGVACGGGYHLLAGLTVAFVLVILRGVAAIETWMGTADPATVPQQAGRRAPKRSAS